MMPILFLIAFVYIWWLHSAWWRERETRRWYEEQRENS